LRSIPHIIRPNPRSGQAHSPFIKLESPNKPFTRLHDNAHHGGFLRENFERRENIT
jgi:hypothetical protein